MAAVVPNSTEDMAVLMPYPGEVFVLQPPRYGALKESGHYYICHNGLAAFSDSVTHFMKTLEYQKYKVALCVNQRDNWMVFETNY